MHISPEDEERLVASVPHALWIDGAPTEAEGGRTLPVHDPATGRVLCEVADASAADGLRALDAAVLAQAAWAETAPRERGEILRRAFDLMIDRADQLALLMTLEMGKPLAESRAEVTYAAEFLRWFSEESVRIAGQYATSPDGATRLLTLKRPVGPTMHDHPVELPARDGHPEDRPGRGGRLHHAGQAGGADPAVDVRPRRAHAGGRPPRRRPQRGDHLDERGRDGAPDPGQPGPQADLHGVDRRRASPRRAVRAAAPAGVDGARWQRAVPGPAGRRPRRRRGRRHAREDAQHGRGLHSGEPVPGARERGPASSRPGWPSAWPRSASGAEPSPACRWGR